MMTNVQHQHTINLSFGAVVAYLTAVLLTLHAAGINNATFATNDYTWIIIQTLACALAAIAFVAIAWKRLRLLWRVIATVIVLVNLWTLLDAGGRRLPAVLGW